MYSLVLLAWVAGSQIPVGAMEVSSKGVSRQVPHPRAPTRPPWGDPKVQHGPSDSNRGEKASGDTPNPNGGGSSNFKRRVRTAAWRWMGKQTLPTGQAGSQLSPPSIWTKEVAQYMSHRHRRDQPTRASHGGVELVCWSWNVQTLQLGQLQESLRTAGREGVHAVLLQSTRWTKPGPREVEGHSVFYSENSDPRQQKGVLIAVSQTGPLKGAVFVPTEVEQGRILAVRAKSSTQDFTFVTAYAPVDVLATTEADRGRFWAAIASPDYPHCGRRF